MYGGSEVTAPPFLTLTLDGGESSASCPCHFTPGETALGTHWIGGWMGPQSWSGHWRREKYCPCQELNPGCPARHYTDWAILALYLGDTQLKSHQHHQLS
jgi:hypothetical protein